MKKQKRKDGARRDKKQNESPKGPQEQGHKKSWQKIFSLNHKFAASFACPKEVAKKKTACEVFL